MAIVGFFIAIIAQIFNGTVSVFDKFLLQRVLKPATFAFWISLTSLVALLFLPFGFAWPNAHQWFLDLAAGAIFTLGVLFMYAALNKEEVTRVMPIVGCFVPVFTILITSIILKDWIGPGELMAIIILIAGTFLLTYRHSNVPTKYLILVYAVLAAFAFAFSSVLMKEIFLTQSFIAGLAWSRLGGLIVWPIALLDSETRSQIFTKREVPEHGNTVIYFIGRAFSGAGFVLVNFSYALLSPVVVNALQGIQYAYLFVANLLLGKFWPQLFNEHLDRKYLTFKIIGLVTIIVGSVILALNS